MAEPDVIPTSASTASTGKGIRYIGEHVYGYNTATVNSTPATILSFTTGTGYITAQINLYGAVSFDSTGQLAGGDVSGLKIKFNDEIVAYIKTDSAQEDMAVPAVFTAIIPPFTKVECDIMSESTSSAYLAAVSITGRVYGAE